MERFLETVRLVISVLADLTTIGASSLAIFLFVSKRKEISHALSLLLNWSFQTTLSDLRGKLDRLNEYNANEPADTPEIKNILHEIAGQIRGNPKLKSLSGGLAEKCENLAKNRRLSEPAKRAIVAESREALRNIQVQSFDNSRGEVNE